MNELDDLDGLLLEQLQSDFPLTPCPFAALGQVLALDEAQVLARVRRLKDAGIIRQISAIFDTRRLGYHSTLVAFHVGAETLETVAAQVSAHPGVSHNYARPHHYNLWFTLAVPPGVKLLAAVHTLAQQAGVEDWLNLPALRVFKIRAYFKLGGDNGARLPAHENRPAMQPCTLTLTDIPYVRELQQDLAIVSRPFAPIARRMGVSEKSLLDKARELEAAGIMRRFGAVLRHRQVGYTANGMACWVVPRSWISDVGRRAATLPQVSHCYERPAYPPRWPYTLFTMVHGQTQEEVESVVAQLARETGLDEYEVLYSTREFKKERVKYFEYASGKS